MLWKRCSATVFAASALMLFASAGLVLGQDDAKAAPSGSAPAPAAKSADDGKDVPETLKALRASIDQQSLQLEMLTRELSLLRKKIDAMGGGEAKGEGAATAKSDEKTTPATSETPAPAAKETTPKEPGQPEVRPAEATGGGVKHVVAKGETLTSIAKQYNIPVATLQKANKIQDGRKMQIGQVLSIPSTETPSEKKENP